MFRIFTKKSNIDISKIKIIQQDADTIDGTISDCLMLDHFERDGYEVITNKVRKIAGRNKTGFLWFWPSGFYYVNWILANNKQISSDTFREWTHDLNIPSYPNTLTPLMIEIMTKLKDRLALHPGFPYISDLEHRNDLLALSRRFNRLNTKEAI